MPRSRGWTEGQLTIGARQTMYQVTSHGADYQWEHNSYQDRIAFDFEANLATTLVREFDLTGFPRFPGHADSLVGPRWLEHMVRPNLIYHYTARSAEDRLPNLDSVDRLAVKNWLTYELNNYFELAGLRSRNIAGSTADYGTGSGAGFGAGFGAGSGAGSGAGFGGGDFYSRALASFKITQTYDIAEARRRNLGPTDSRREFSDLRFDLQASPIPQLSFRYRTNFSMYGEGFTRHELQGDYIAPTGLQWRLNYRFLKYDTMVEPYFYTTAGVELHDLSTQVTVPLSSAVTLRGLLRYSFSDKHITEAVSTMTYKPHCWALDIEARRHVDENSIMVVFRLDSVGQAFSWLKGDL